MASQPPRTATATPSPMPMRRLCPDWVFSPGSNVHVAKDREWFTTYIAFESTVTTPEGTTLPVLGVGTVHLPVRKCLNPKRSGSNTHNTLRLKHVLHVPSAVCNVLGQRIAGRVNMTVGVSEGQTKGAIMSKRGRRPAAFFKVEHARLAVRLSGPPVGPPVQRSVFPRAKARAEELIVDVTWSNKELGRWGRQWGAQRRAMRELNEWLGDSGAQDGPSPKLAAKQGTKLGTSLGTKPVAKRTTKPAAKQGQKQILNSKEDQIRKLEEALERLRMDDGAPVKIEALQKDTGGVPIGDANATKAAKRSVVQGPPNTEEVPPYTDEEKNWLKKAWRGEFRFLRAHGLNIHKDEHREEGRLIVRGLMSEDDEDSTWEDLGAAASRQSSRSGPSVAGSDTKRSAPDGQSNKAIAPSHNARLVGPGQRRTLVEPPYTAKEEKWLTRNYVKENLFLRSQGLSMTSEADREEGRTIARGLMAEDDFSVSDVSDVSDESDDDRQYGASLKA